jgi:hypothetical protein
MSHDWISTLARTARQRVLLPLGMVLAAAVAMPGYAVAATTLVVDADGTYDAATSGCSGSDVAYTTINAANTAAVDGDTIFVCPGTYPEIQINITKAITLQGSGAATTIIDGGGGTGLASAGTVRIRTTTGNVTVDGFTIQNASAQGAAVTGLRFAISSKSSAPVTYTITHNVLRGLNNPAWGQDYGIYTDGPSALETMIFQHNTIKETGSNPILIERHVGPTDVSFNTFDRGVRSAGISAYFNMSHTGTVVTSLQKVSNNVVNMANDPGPYNSGNASSGIVFNSAFTGTTVGRFTNVEISGNTITGLESFRRGIVISNGANVGLGANGEITGLVIACNDLSGPAVPGAGSVGIRMLGQHAGPDIHNNSIADVETGFLARDNNGHIATGILLNENSFTNIGVYAIDWWNNVSFDAESNWFDDASGPAATGNPAGTGAAIGATGGPAGSPAVDYVPWLGSGSDADAGTCFVPGDSGECVGVSTCDPINGCTAPPTNDGGSCDDGLYCNGADTCSAGACGVHTGDPCSGGSECANVCDEASDSCDVVAGTTCTDDGQICSADVCDGAGSCTHPAGNAGVECRAAADACEIAAVCDGASTACPANATLPDADSDGTCDDVDVCTTLDPGQVFGTKPKSRVVLSKVNSETVPGNDGLVISASFALPPGRSFADVTPITDGARVVITAAGGAQRLDATIPGGAYSAVTKVGWKLAGNGKKWTFVDKSATPVGGIGQLVINDKNTSRTPRGVKVTVKGKKSTYPVIAADVPIQATVTLGDATAAAQGLCGESAYAAANCAFNAPQNKLTCRR